MHLCSLSITYACPYHNPTATMGHSIHNIDISKPLTHMTHLLCHLPCTVKTGIHPWREHLSKVPDAIKCEHLPTQVGYDDELQSGRDPDEDDEHADELPWDGFWQFVQKFFGYANRLLQQLSGWLVSDDLGGEDAGCGGPGLVWLHVVCGRGWHGSGFSNLSRPTPTEKNLVPSQSHGKTGGKSRPVPLPEEWLPFPPTPSHFFFFCFGRNLSVTVKI